MTQNEKCIARLTGMDIGVKEENGTVYVLIEDIQLELADYEVNCYRA